MLIHVATCHILKANKCIYNNTCRPLTSDPVVVRSWGGDRKPYFCLEEVLSPPMLLPSSLDWCCKDSQTVFLLICICFVNTREYRIITAPCRCRSSNEFVDFSICNNMIMTSYLTRSFCHWLDIARGKVPTLIITHSVPPVGICLLNHVHSLIHLIIK